MKTFTITTPLYYVNDVPHIGHAYTTIACDALARWQRVLGKPVFFLTGTDEHGQKIATASEQKGEAPQVYVNRIAQEFKRLWDVLGITYDDFIQTTEERHRVVVQSVFEKLKASGDIYKGTYEDWYCMHDESYYSESELVNKKCPTCGREVQKLKEESYFFKLSHYEQHLLDHFQSHPEFLSPPVRANEIINFVKSGLKDLSVSRTRVKWGIPVTSDPSHTVYVWFDALLNYITAAGYDGVKPKSEFETRWPADVHVVGKEIYRFHTVIWPAMLMALNLPLPKKVFAHGWWTVDGEKMSKSLGNVVDPHAMVAEYGVDAFRYFLLREVPFGADGDFSEKSLLNRYNAELANNLGNLLQRTLTLVLKNFQGKIPARTQDSTVLNDVPKLLNVVDGHFETLRFDQVLQEVYGVLIRTNKFIDDKAPWTLGADQKEALSAILLECLQVLKILAVLLYPFMPGKMSEVWEKLGETSNLKDAAPACLISWKKGEGVQFAAGQVVKKGDPLFMRKGGRWK